MLNNLILEDILFLDIETVPQVYEYHKMEEPLRNLWDQKIRFLLKEGEKGEDVYTRAGIYSEFGKIVCVSVGFLTNSGGKRVLRVKSFCGDDEKDLLQRFRDMLDDYFNLPHHLLCAHNGKEFDFPYLSRRMLVNEVRLPKALNIAGKKPWEVQHLDTMELWKFGDYKNFTSLNLLAHIFGIPTPKDDIDGSQVAKVYWEEKNLDRIVMYCQKDVVTLARLLVRFQGEPFIEDEDIIFAE